MNYVRIYNELIMRGVERETDPSQYYEIHHIVPKCIGGSNDQQNLVKLTAKEHFLAHLMLVKIHPAVRSILRASMMMRVSSKFNQRKVNSRRYDWVKRQYCQSIRDTAAKNRGFKNHDDMMLYIWEKIVVKKTHNASTISVGPDCANECLNYYARSHGLADTLSSRRTEIRISGVKHRQDERFKPYGFLTFSEAKTKVYTEFMNDWSLTTHTISDRLNISEHDVVFLLGKCSISRSRKKQHRIMLLREDEAKHHGHDSYKTASDMIWSLFVCEKTSRREASIQTKYPIRTISRMLKSFAQSEKDKAQLAIRLREEKQNKWSDRKCKQENKHDN